MSKPINAKLTPGKSKQLLDAVAGLAPHLQTLLPIYLQATPARREALLAHSPVLAEFVALLSLSGIEL
jgi:hypothetical protein